MEDTTTPAVTVPDTYNSNLLVTYKVIRGYSDAEYATDKVTTLEWDLHNGRQSQKTVTTLNSKIDTVKDIITEAYADSDDQETLRAIAEALDIELTRTVQWSASIEVSGTIELDLLAGYDTDIESEITDALFADSNNGNACGTTSEKLATNILNRMLYYMGSTNRGVKTAEHAVTKRCEMPAALTEVGFITNPTEVYNMTTDEYQYKAAQGIAEGIMITLKDINVPQ